MNIIRINGLTIEFENGVEVITESPDRVIVRKAVEKLPPLAPYASEYLHARPLLGLVPRHFPKSS